METTFISGTITMNEPTRFTNNIPVLYSILEYTPASGIYSASISNMIGIAI